MSSPERIKRKKKEPPQLTSNPSLPYDLLLSCIAPVSRLYYPTLSLVSKSLRSLIASPELYEARSRLSHTESCLYVSIESSCVSGLTWYTLCRKPNKALISETKSKSSGQKSQFPILLMRSHHVLWRLVLKSATLADPMSSPCPRGPALGSRYWIVGLTRWARLQACGLRSAYLLQASLTGRFM